MSQYTQREKEKLERLKSGQGKGATTTFCTQKGGGETRRPEPGGKDCNRQDGQANRGAIPAGGEENKKMVRGNGGETTEGKLVEGGSLTLVDHISPKRGLKRGEPKVKIYYLCSQ